jgi:NAD(P)-dependent dehydrogenase (short-subunit alcohol dehydrogenase family)
MRSSQDNKWTETDVPVQRGRTAVVTGANTGLGFETARVLAMRGARVVLACRDLGRAKEAAARILGGRPQPAGAPPGEPAGAPPGDVQAVRLELASLASVREAAEEIGAAYGPVDLLVNNAGVMWTPLRRTADGFELQLGVNHLGHFALTGLLLGAMLGREGSRVVTVSSNAHKSGRIDFEDLQSQRRYRRGAAYGQSKLANLMFTYELERRLAAAGAKTQALAAHPGKARTELIRYLSGWMRVVDLIIEEPLGQSAAMGALATLRAATDPAARGAEYYGPAGRGELRGYPRLVTSTERARDLDAQQRLWRESERLTGVTYPV